MNPLTGHTIGEFSKSLSVSTPHLLSMRGKCQRVSNCFNLQLCRKFVMIPSPLIKNNFAHIFPFQNRDRSTSTVSCGEAMVRPKCSVGMVIAKVVPFVTPACEHGVYLWKPSENVNIIDMCCPYACFSSKQLDLLWYYWIQFFKHPWSVQQSIICLWLFRKLLKEVVSSVNVEIENKNCPLKVCH